MNHLFANENLLGHFLDDHCAIFLNIMISSISEQSHTNLSFFRLVPAKPSTLFTKVLIGSSHHHGFDSVRKLLSSVRRSRPLPYLRLIFRKY
ncbi:MAG: hypothetical protein IPH20_17835 [Bacteroidales bacterium]|nr:hypothetical protein [Bacteroidales bacterium]